jgi:predicted ATPase
LVHAEFFVGFVRQHRREADAARERADSVITLSTGQGFALWLAWASTMRGCAWAHEGRHQQGITQVQEGLAMSLATGTKLARTEFLCVLAEVCIKAGRFEEGGRAVAEALAAADQHESRLCEAEVHRLKGELLLTQSPYDRNGAMRHELTNLQSADQELSPLEGLGIRYANDAEAQSCFERAITIARNQNAKSWELRATTSLARLLVRQSRREEARALLAAIYNWFTEGFDTADLKDAKALLEELN